MTNYDNGSALERRARAELRAAGYEVGRVRGSLGCADLIALPRLAIQRSRATSRPLLVQVKGGPNPRLDPDEWNDLFWMARDVDAVAVLATKPGRSRNLTWQLMTAAKTVRGKRSPLAPFTVAPLGADDL